MIYIKITRYDARDYSARIQTVHAATNARYGFDKFLLSDSIQEAIARPPDPYVTHRLRREPLP